MGFAEWSGSWVGCRLQNRLLCTGLYAKPMRIIVHSNYGAKLDVYLYLPLYSHLYIVRSSHARFGYVLIHSVLLFHQGDRSEKVGVIDSEYVLHKGIPSLGGPRINKVDVHHSSLVFCSEIAMSTVVLQLSYQKWRPYSLVFDMNVLCYFSRLNLRVLKVQFRTARNQYPRYAPVPIWFVPIKILSPTNHRLSSRNRIEKDFIASCTEYRQWVMFQLRRRCVLDAVQFLMISLNSSLLGCVDRSQKTCVVRYSFFDMICWTWF